jgi:hypothetical protein
MAGKGKVASKISKLVRFSDLVHASTLPGWGMVADPLDLF